MPSQKGSPCDLPGPSTLGTPPKSCNLSSHIPSMPPMVTPVTQPQQVHGADMASVPLSQAEGKPPKTPGTRQGEYSAQSKDMAAQSEVLPLNEVYDLEQDTNPLCPISEAAKMANNSPTSQG